MNHTNYVILKLLLQQPLKEKVLLNYLNINVNTLRKAVFQINMKLTDLNLPIIKEVNSIYRILLSKKQRDFFYASCDEYSHNQRVNYLSLKILIEKSLNLEFEKKVLNISRATIARDIFLIKQLFSEKNIHLISKKWEGVFCQTENNSNLYQYVFELLIILYSEYNTLPGILKSYINLIQPKPFEIMVKEILEIFDHFSLQIENIAVRYFLSLNVCISTFENFYLASVLDYVNKIKNSKKFKNIKSKIISNKSLEKKIKLYVAMMVYSAIYKTFYLENVSIKKVIYYCNYFNLSLEKEEQCLLNSFFYLSKFRYKNELHDVKNIYLSSEFDKKILEELKIFFKETNLNFLYGDLLELLDFTKYFFIKNNKKNSKRILILKKDIITYYMDLESHLKQIYPNFKFEIRPYSYIYVLKDSNNLYDFILSDTILGLDFNYKLCQINMSLINIINNYLIEDYLKNRTK